MSSTYVDNPPAKALMDDPELRAADQAFIPPLPLKAIKSKIVGVKMGRKINGEHVRQTVLKKLRQEVKPARTTGEVQLRPEPTNKFDKDAIAVYVRLTAGWFEVGYISNKQRVCSNPVCGWDMDPEVSGDAPEECPECGFKVLRKGLASRLSEWMRAGQKFACRITQFTGKEHELDKNGEPRSLGANIEISPVGTPVR